MVFKFLILFLHLGILQSSLTYLLPFLTLHHGIKLWSGFLVFKGNNIKHVSPKYLLYI